MHQNVTHIRGSLDVWKYIWKRSKLIFWVFITQNHFSKFDTFPNIFIHSAILSLTFNDIQVLEQDEIIRCSTFNTKLVFAYKIFLLIPRRVIPFHISVVIRQLNAVFICILIGWFAWLPVVKDHRSTVSQPIEDSSIPKIGARCPKAFRFKICVHNSHSKWNLSGNSH